MTYVSRRTRIIISRYPDECDTDYVLRACRKRSDGRLKMYSSCHDFRVWINDNCIKNEHFVELMSEGEFAGPPPFKLYGRFIPVPILFKLMQNLIGSEVQINMKNARSATSTRTYTKEVLNGVCGQPGFENNKNEFKYEGLSHFSKVHWEKKLLERSLFECTCLLNKAINQLEKVDALVSLAIEEAERGTNQKPFAFMKFKQTCSCSALTNSENVNSSKPSAINLKGVAKYTELFRKISGLKEKLEKIQEFRRGIKNEIQLSKQRTKCLGVLPVTESRREHEYVKKLQKKMTKLKSDRDLLLFEMCEDLTSLNNLKRSFHSTKDENAKDNRGACDNEKLEEPVECTCGMCRIQSQKSLISDSFGTDSNENIYDTSYQMNEVDSFDCQTQYESLECKTNSAKPSEDISKYEDFKTPSGTLNTSKINVQKSERKSSLKLKNDVGATEKRDGISEKVKVDKSECSNKYYADDISFYENSLSPEQEKIVLGILKSIQPPRPSTSPTTRKERQAANFGMSDDRRNSYGLPKVSERRVKSETTMKEIEKALRNYERRLTCFDCLEDKVENLREKVSEGQELKEKMEQIKVEMSKRAAADREKSVKEINRLCSENWALKQQVEELMAKYSAQSKKMQSLKCNMLRARDLERQTEEMKKKLSEYRDNIEHQRKCISNWENVVAVQNTEIQNLINHIKKLRMVREQEASSPYEEKYVQRSRSFSPEIIAGRVFSRPRTQRTSNRPEDEEFPCGCSECKRSDSKRKMQRVSADKTYRSPNGRRLEWCV